MLSASSRLEAFEMMIVSRGRGRGHAVPDMAIGAKVAELLPNVRLQYVSYAAGAETYRACGHQVLDLDVPTDPPFLDMVIVFTRLLGQVKPQMVVAHEEVPVLPAAQVFGIPCIFITDFFTDPNSLSMKALQYAAEIIFTAESGLYTEPPSLKSKICYVGRAVRQFEYTLADRHRARRELGIPIDATVALCQPGMWAESQLPLADLFSAAWNLVPKFPRHLIWVAGRDYERLMARFNGQDDVIILKEDWKIDRLLSASDVLITKANRLTVYEAASLGLPSISISNLLNWPDDVAVANVKSNTAIRTGSTTPEGLSALITEKLATKFIPATEISGGVAAAAARIAYHVDLIGRSSSPAHCGG